jgi:hypothetical protein
MQFAGSEGWMIFQSEGKAHSLHTEAQQTGDNRPIRLLECQSGAQPNSPSDECHHGSNVVTT